MARRICRLCRGDGFVKPFRRDQWGFGVPCSRCDGTGDEPKGGYANSEHEDGDASDCPVEGCGDSRPHYHREDTDWGDYKVYTDKGQSGGTGP